MSVEDDEKNKKELINIAFSELRKAISQAKDGTPPTNSFSKLKNIYDTLSESEKKRQNEEITEEEMHTIMANEVNKLKESL